MQPDVEARVERFEKHPRGPIPENVTSGSSRTTGPSDQLRAGLPKLPSSLCRQVETWRSPLNQKVFVYLVVVALAEPLAPGKDQQHRDSKSLLPWVVRDIAGRT